MNRTVKYITAIAIIASLIITASTKSRSGEIKTSPNKVHFCRRFIYAPKCRGMQAKRDISKLEPLLEEPRFSQENYDDLRKLYENQQWQENELSKNRLLDTLLRKITSRSSDYDSGTDDYAQ